MSYGFVYVACNDAFPGLYKIGSTSGSPSQRIQQLSASTSTPKPFELICTGEFQGHDAIEREIHRVWDSHRVNPRREFFRLNTKEVCLIADWMEEHANFAWTNHWRLHMILEDEAHA